MCQFPSLPALRGLWLRDSLCASSSQLPCSNGSALPGTPAPLHGPPPVSQDTATVPPVLPLGFLPWLPQSRGGGSIRGSVHSRGAEVMG